SFGVVIGNSLFPVWFFQGTEKMKYISIINIICSLAYVICVFAFVKIPEDYLYVPLLTSLFSVISGISGLYIAFKRFGLTFAFQGYHNIRKQLKAGWNIFISIVAINAYTTTRIFAVGLLTNNTITGFYSIAERIANFIQTFPLESFSQAIFPRLNKIFSVNKKRATKLMHKIQRSTAIIFLLVIPILFFLAPGIVKIVCGTQYAEVTSSLKLLLLAVLFVGANTSRVQFLLVSGRTDLYSKLHITAAIVGLPLVFFLISWLSYTGAAISTIIIEGGIFISTFFLIKKALKF
ncbi:MAG: oligosaccharide flippase family protein, partial [Candidatus Omnitrophica bacterium]|nr:oligosaccharide flippase family protein [Candidatus Omnitrophota bacterium]